MKYLILITLFLTAAVMAGPAPAYDLAKMQREKLGRGVIAVRQNADEVFVTWRYLSRDAMDTAFDVYRDGKKINKQPIKDVTFFVDKNKGGGVYSVKPAGRNEKSVSWTLPADAPIGYVNIPLDRPEGGTAPDGREYTYAPNDASIGDVDGDGEFEIILKWDPSNSHDNSHAGYTGNVYLDCYKLDGTKLWRIDLGRNIRAGAHYTQFMVYDLDGDGSAEIVVKTADGTVDGKGKVIGNADADHRNKNGYILEGPEFLTVFSGRTGEALDTIDYIPARGKVTDWGDPYGNRVDRFLAAVAYLDGVKPSVVMCRGYYTRTVLAAFDWDGKKLKHRWTFDSGSSPENKAYRGQGNHSLQVADVNGDGKDEIIYGSMAINNDGTGLYSTGLGHGDAMHVTQFSPDLPGLQLWQCHESGKNGATLRDAATGEILFQVKSDKDVGRCSAADIDPTNPGLEMWASHGVGMRNIKGEKMPLPEKPKLPINMFVWWDGDLLREMLDGNTVSKWDWKAHTAKPLVQFEGASSNNGTKSTPCLQADITGDWREEVLLRSNENDALRLYISTIPTEYRFHTFLEDPVYRLSIVTQNVGYNQPTQPGFYFGPDLLEKGKERIFRGTRLEGK